MGQRFAGDVASSRVRQEWFAIHLRAVCGKALSSGKSMPERNVVYRIAISSVVPNVIARQTQRDLVITMVARAGLEPAAVFGSLPDGLPLICL